MTQERRKRREHGTKWNLKRIAKTRLGAHFHYKFLGRRGDPGVQLSFPSGTTTESGSEGQILWRYGLFTHTLGMPRNLFDAYNMEDQQIFITVLSIS